MTVLGASAVLALLLHEPDGDAVLAVVDGATLSAVNLAEVLAKLSDRAQPVDDLPEDLAAALRRLDQGRLRSAFTSGWAAPARRALG